MPVDVILDPELKVQTSLCKRGQGFKSLLECQVYPPLCMKYYKTCVIDMLNENKTFEETSGIYLLVGLGKP